MTIISLMRSALIASEAYNFWYNQFNQLERVQDPNGDFIEYTYNAQGLRTKKDFLDHAVNYIYDRGNIILESDQDYLVTAKNIRGLQLIYRETGDETLYYLHNAHGDVTKLLNDKGWVIKDYDYDPFGREEAAPIKAFGGDISTEIWRNETQQIDNPFRYCGEYLDDETGNYYLRARYYDPEARRFTTEDSYRGDNTSPLSLNWYAYCRNNPVSFVDPSGHWEEGDENLSPDAQEEIEAATKEWEDAEARGDQDGMARAHERAEKARNGGGSSSSESESFLTVTYAQCVPCVLVEGSNPFDIGIGTQQPTWKQAINFITWSAEQNGVPIDLALAVAWTESNFRQFLDNGSIRMNKNIDASGNVISTDYGIMQINDKANPHLFDPKYGDIKNNWHDNVNAGMWILRDRHNEAIILGYEGDRLIKATYSNYNSYSCSAFEKYPNSDVAKHVADFWDAYIVKSWLGGEI